MNGGNVCRKEYPFISERMGVWREIVRYLLKDIGEVDSVLELGAGYCDFINQFPADKKICIDQEIEMKEFAAKEVDFRVGDAVMCLDSLSTSVDLVFASNFLEHLSQEQHTQLMPRLYQFLNDEGKLVLIQPNYNLCQKNYFDDETHQTIFSDENIMSFLEKYGFEVVKLVPGLLPFSMKSKLPKWPWLVRCYLFSPIKPKAAQMYVIAKKKDKTCGMVK